MYTNADITLYSKVYDTTTRLDKWERRIINNVFFDNVLGANTNKSGMDAANSVVVFVPLANIDIEPKTGDYIVYGRIYDDISKITDLTKKYTNAHVLTAVDKKDFGSMHMRHYELHGK